jgi:AraC-like DNA-binding protein
MSRETTVGALQVTDLFAALDGLGAASTALCRAVGLERGVLRDPAARVPARVVVALLAEAERRTRDPFVGLHAGERAEPRGPLIYLIMSSARLEEGLRLAARFAGVVIDGLRIELEVGRDSASIVYALRDDALSRQRHVVDYLLMANLSAMGRAAGRVLRLREVHVRHAGPGPRHEEARAFGCPVRFAQRDNGLVFPAEELQAASRLANPLIAEQIEKFAAALLSQVTPPLTLSERVADVARVLLAGGMRADRAAVARRLGTSYRTLQRSLVNEETTFKAVRDAVLWEVVEALLSNPALKVEAVGLSAGFGDAAAFSKAFKRRTGCSPTQYRQRLAPQKTPAPTSQAAYTGPMNSARRPILAVK